MKKVFHKLRDYVLALLALMTISACCDNLNTLTDPHFTEEGTLIKKPSFAKLDRLKKSVMLCSQQDVDV